MAENIYEALRESHETQRSLCRELLRATSQSGRRGEIFRELRIELAAHAAAEERFLYAPILMDDMGLSPSRHALAEHHEIDECVRSEEHTSELQSLMRISYAVFCLKNKKKIKQCKYTEDNDERCKVDR